MGKVVKFTVFHKKTKYIGLIDQEDAHLIIKYKWRVIIKLGVPYITCDFPKGSIIKTGNLHRSILEITDPKIIVDHKNQNPLDNRRCNLRLADKSTNGMNRGKNKNNKCGYKGVSYDSRQKRWCAEIMAKGIRYRNFVFDTKEEAAQKYNELALKYHGEFAVLNIIKQTKEKNNVS